MPVVFSDTVNAPLSVMSGMLTATFAVALPYTPAFVPETIVSVPAMFVTATNVRLVVPSFTEPFAIVITIVSPVPIVPSGLRFAVSDTLTSAPRVWPAIVIAAPCTAASR